jgi:four helix bundle protein
MGGNHTKLEVWNVAMELAETIYQITSKFPKDERFGLTI